MNSKSKSKTKTKTETKTETKKAVYFGRTLEWSENGLGVRPDRRHVRSLLRELGMEKLSKYLHATECHSGEGRSLE